jgi:hypothetical protein
MSIIERCGTQLSLPVGWVDSSDDAGNSNHLLTLTRPDGVGAFQASFGQYVSGKLPNIRMHDLHELLANFASTRCLGLGLNPSVGEHGGVAWCRADYYRGDDFIRVWYVSDSMSVVLATYICDRQYKHIEVNDCDQIIQSVRFLEPQTTASRE